MEPPSTVSVSVSNETAFTHLPAARVGSSVRFTLTEAGFSGRVHVSFLTDDAIRELNRKFRGVDAPTDVLTFPGPSFEGAPLGDIVISVDTAQVQAGARKVSLTNELCLLGIHGALHLRGLDDLEEADRLRMQAEMARIANALNLKAGDDWQSLYEVVS